MSDASGCEPVLVAGVGNIFRSDDGFGSAVVGELLTRSIDQRVRVVDYGIRAVHLAFDLSEDVQLLVVVDSIPDAGGGPGSMALIEVDPATFATANFDAHAMDPGAVFAALGALHDDLPTTVVLGCEPATLDDGIGLSPPVAAAVPRAVDRVVKLVDQFLSHNTLLKERTGGSR